MTKDERFLTELYRAILDSKDEQATVNPALIAKRLGYKDLLIKDIIKNLRKANLIDFDAPDEAYLTERGLLVARSLLQSHA